MPRRAREVAFLGEHHAEIALGKGAVRHQSHRLVQVDQRAVQVIAPGQCQPEIELRVGIARVELYGFVVTRERFRLLGHPSPIRCRD